VRDDVVISHRGAAYEIGRGKSFYGIWQTGGPRSQPCEWWPATPPGWASAWQRFTWLEAPGAIVTVSRGPLVSVSAGTGSVVAAVLLAVGTVFGIGSLFPGYVSTASLASEPPELVTHAFFLAVWAAAAVLVLLRGARLRAGALLALGTSVVSLGFYVSDLGSAFSGGHVAAGLVLALVGWLACAAGSVLAACIRPDDAQARQHRYERGSPGRLALFAVAALGTVIAFVPAWDSFTLHTSTQGVQTITEGYAFSEPGIIAAGDVIVMIALVVTVIAAALLRPARQGGLLLAGAIVPMAAQAVSAVVQIAQPATPAQFGVGSAEAQQLGLTISSGLKPAFWIYCAFLLGLALLCARMLIPSRPGLPAMAPAGPAPFLPGAQLAGTQVPGPPMSGAAAPGSPMPSGFAPSDSSGAGYAPGAPPAAGQQFTAPGAPPPAAQPPAAGSGPA
jgi:hypothetical protein